MPKPKRYVVTHPQHGLLLGFIGEKMLWTDVVGPELLGRSTIPANAVTWTDRAEAAGTVQKVCDVALSARCIMVEVDCLFSDRAHVGECFKAGIPMWNCTCQGEA